MGQRDCGNLQPRCCSGKKPVAEFTGRHFNREFVCTSEFLHIDMTDDAGQTKSPGRADHQSLVGLAAAAAQSMVQVSDSQMPRMLLRKVMEDVKQYH
jgi:hypothetical protein